MAEHKTLGSLAIDTIDEYLKASDICLRFRKPDRGCLGCPATLLLFCVINALGVCLDGDNVTIDGCVEKITEGEPFRVLNHECFGLELSRQQIKLLEHSYRNRLAHNAIIEMGSYLLPQNDDPPFIFEPEKVKIKVFSFYRLVSGGYSRFPKERIHSWANRLQTPRVIRLRQQGRF